MEETGGPFFCCDERRRNEVAARPDVNGIEFLEVLDAPDMAPEDRQRTLFVHFIHDPSGLALGPGNVAVDGGQRIRDLRVTAATVQVDSRSGSASPVLVVEVDRPGDFSIYTLRLGELHDPPPPGVDPVLRAVDFSFKVECPTGFDPLEARRCPPEPRVEPALDYLARDYPSLRQLVLDRLAVLVPGWQERNPSDIGVALVELLAYLGDQLSYRQDAVATEAYFGTCRLRTSARRHARLVDYVMHDGCNARAWVQVRVREPSSPFDLAGATFYSALPGLPPRLGPDSEQLARARESAATTFRQLGTATLAPEHNEIHFYTWGGRECCLPKGAVRATLRGELPNLKPGMVLVFVEVLSPRTGDRDDADISHRHAVRLTEVGSRTDPIGGRFDPSATDDPVAVTEIRWAADDALPFPVCISAESDPQYGGGFVGDVSVALGNIVLADHGAEAEEPLGEAPADTLVQVQGQFPADDPGEGGCRPERGVPAPARFRPRLSRRPLTQAIPYDDGRPPAAARQDLESHPRDAMADVWLSDDKGGLWKPRQDLLSSSAVDAHFVVEVEADGRAQVRFGDGEHGRRPPAGHRFTAHYRVGNGRAGNVGAETLVHIVCADDRVVGASNPLPAAGGVEMESIDEARQRAPVAFRPQGLPGQPARPDGRSLRRAVTPGDYAAVAETHGEVQRAAATFRWTGSWRTMSVTVDRLGGLPLTDEVEDSLRDHLERYRLAGHDLEVDAPLLVALEIAMRVQVAPRYFASEVRRALVGVFSNRLLPDGRRGLFHADNLTFNQVVYLSPLYAAAQAVDGVESVDVTTFQRRDRPGPAARDAGRLVLGRLEIARLDNDPNFPERGTFVLTVEGGR